MRTTLDAALPCHGWFACPIKRGCLPKLPARRCPCCLTPSQMSLTSAPSHLHTVPAQGARIRHRPEAPHCGISCCIFSPWSSGVMWSSLPHTISTGIFNFGNRLSVASWPVSIDARAPAGSPTHPARRCAECPARRNPESSAGCGISSASNWSSSAGVLDVNRPVSHAGFS